MKDQIVMKHIGAPLKDLRTAAGLSQDHVAFFTRSTRERYGRLERGGSFPTINEVKALCVFFSVDLEALGLSREDLTSAVKTKTGRDRTRESALRNSVREKKAAKKKKEKKAEEKKVTDKAPAAEKEEDKRTLPPMPERISGKGTRSLIYATLYSAIHDARQYYAYEAAAPFEAVEKFVRADWCRELCEGVNLDYKTYRDHVLEIARKTAKLADALLMAKDPIKYKRAEVFATSYEAVDLCKDLRQDYDKFVERVHEAAHKTLVAEEKRRCKKEG